MTTPTNGSGAATTAATPDNDNDDDRLSQRLWHDALPLAYFSLHHPFVHGIAAGTLPRAQWLDYVAQDAHYLRHFSSAYAHAMDKLDARAQLAESGVSGGGPEQAQRLRDARARVGRLLSSVLDELRLHGGYAARWGVPKETLERGASRETEAYTGFLHSVAADPRSPPGDVLAAMAPCLRLYAWLGCSLKSGNEAARRALGGEENNPNPYGEWVETYSGEEYKAMVEVGERLLDEAAALGGGDGGDAERDFGELF
jgi:thiaminase